MGLASLTMYHEKKQMSNTEQRKKGVQLKKPIELPAAVRLFLMGLSLTELRVLLDEGRLLAALKTDSPDLQRTYWLALLGVQERYWKDATVLSLRFDFRANSGEASVKLELVLEYALDTDRLLSCYSDLDDPELPAWVDLALPPGGLGEEERGKSARNLPQKSNEAQVKKLHYLPRGRVSFLVSSDDPGVKFVFKIVASEAFNGCLHVARQLKKSDLRNRLAFPRIIYHSKAKQLFIYRYLPGLGFDGLLKDKASGQMKARFKRVIETLSLIHQTRTLDLPSWVPEIETRIMRSLLNHILKRASLASHFVRPLFDRITQNFAEKRQSYTYLIHNDFRAKHLLYDETQANSDSISKLSVIDWDSALLGPKEKDIALFLYSASKKVDAWRLFLRLYQEQFEDPLDLDFVNHLLQYRILIKRSRDFLRHKITLEDYLHHMDSITKQLDENPLSP